LTAPYNVDGNTGSDLAFSVEPTLDKESTGLLDCRWVEAQTSGGVRHIYTALRLRSRQDRSRHQDDGKCAEYSHGCNHGRGFGIIDFKRRCECLKKMNQCDMIEVRILKLGPYPEIGPINLTDPMRIVAWTKDGLTAAGDTHLCQRTQLNVDFVHRKIQLVATDRCHPGNPAVIEEVRTFPTSAFERKSP
jgi:hypothetical protein